MVSSHPREDDKYHRERQGPTERSEKHSHKRRKTEEYAEQLPYNARHLTKHDLTKYRALFGLYLDTQKQLSIDKLDEHEIKGRWKSFTGKWNRGELSEGYYDPAMKVRADARASDRQGSRVIEDTAPSRAECEEAKDEDDEDDYGPARPKGGDRGAAQPTRQDLQYRDELKAEARESEREALRHERKVERKQQRERLDDIVPRAEPGTRERQLEKKREMSEANRSFRDGREAGAEEVGDGDLMGEDGVEGLKARIREQERKKSERELRKEEVLQARAAEREERLTAHRAKEDKTMEMLKEIAKQRFG
ncbi:hypothetical protein BDZ85DRAFT_48686 [Elsinoe ampelina]|uniref:Uncharacterized protein n=1 Tax=Elsinoe ampelina TaxID=302913 RepID=A0A6A6GKQ6_9PEZI|nr:hypothetical protein BDZ85DRAFT_48686 [Elsinoe ampelina]